ncbi:hypothetical protein [Lysinibacillus sp. fls2-241-R2A-57]|uniref:hypothetical protein n=1 Tax=Lysinibacillus sp. fls2-241-R2A-57 TaxID=3040292 RepID=UPI0025543A0D|nr:hypothetical protein [Lysinibacillus sp. fls2-241-R2A-57]
MKYAISLFFFFIQLLWQFICSESKATATNVFCAKAKRQQQLSQDVIDTMREQPTLTLSQTRAIGICYTKKDD